MHGFRIARRGALSLRGNLAFLLALPLMALGFARRLPDLESLAGVTSGELGGTPSMWGIGFSLAVVSSVLARELARGPRTAGDNRPKEVMLLVFGGAALLGEPIATPREHMHAAARSMLTSLALFVFFASLERAVPSGWIDARFAFFNLSALNLALFLLHCVPALPFDAGRVLRASLASRRGLLSATRCAANAGKTLALLLGLCAFAIFDTPLVVLALFVYLGAAIEERAVALRALAGALPVSELARTDVETVPGELTVEQLAERMSRGRRGRALVRKGDGTVGLLTGSDVDRLPAHARTGVRVAELAQALPVLDASEDVEQALLAFEQSDAAEVSVRRGDELVGTVRRSDVISTLALRRRLGASAARADRPPSR